jgi:DNA modification methylase
MMKAMQKEIDINSINDYCLLLGDSVEVLKRIPSGSVNCTVTSPPYWGQRDYDMDSAIGLEREFDAYLKNLLSVFDEVYRVTAVDGSLWLNMGDRYVNKNLVGMPWRVALALKDRGWILRQDVIWDKMRLTQSAKDRLRTIHEYVFHFVKNPKYYYDRESIVLKHKERPKKINGRIRSITGVTGIKYEREIRESKYLTKSEKSTALKELQNTLVDMEKGRILDFRMYVRGRPRIYNGNNHKLSGRAKEIKDKGFFIKTHKPDGDLPTNIWRMVPEDVHREDAHCAVYPVSLMELPIKATCPPNGIVCDPFMGTGTSIVTAIKYGRSAIGIDINKTFVSVAEKRIKKYIETGLEC